MAWRWKPSRWLLWTGATGALIGISWKFGPPRDDVRGAEGHLLGFGEEVVRVAVEHHPAQRRDGHELFRDDLGRIQDVEGEAFGLFFREHLHAQFPLRISA